MRDHARLSSEVLGRFFKQDKFSSFQRQLNLYGFRKITKGSEAGSYQHPHFRRGERTTLLTIRRSTKPSQALRQPSRVPGSPASTRTPSPTDCDQTPPVTTTKTATTNTTNCTSGGSNHGSAKARPATPSPPPDPVARGVLPWSHQQPNTLPSLPPDLREQRGLNSEGSSITSGGSGGSRGAQNGQRLDGMEVEHSAAGAAAERRWDHRQHGGATATGRVDSVSTSMWGAEGGKGGYPNVSNGDQPDAGRGWVGADSNQDGRRWGGEGGRSWNAVGAAATTMVRAEDGEGSAGADGGGTVALRSRPAVVDREHERAEPLDHHDVEVVGLLQRMAKKSQDSPSRTPDRNVEQQCATAQPPPMEPRWEEARTIPSLVSRPQPFRMPRPLVGSDPRGDGESAVSTANFLFWIR